MKGRFINCPSITERDDSDYSPENSSGSPPTVMFTDTKLLASTSSPKRSRRSTQNGVVSVPIKEVDGSRLKGDIGNTPPSDSWAWRKYGQKPIKGSPYPRGYYRCSSSKGCPARKQVERSRDDPNVLLVTYSCEHNHPWPATRNNQKSQNNYSTSSIITTMSVASDVDAICKSEQEEPASPIDAICKFEQEEEEEEDDKQHPPTTKDNVSSDNLNNARFDDQQVLPLAGGGEFGWFSDYECTSGHTMLESKLLSEGRLNIDDEIMNIDVFGGSSMMREEDELLFGDLGELPECSTVFRRGMIQWDEERRTPWCGTTS